MSWARFLILSLVSPKRRFSAGVTGNTGTATGTHTATNTGILGNALILVQNNVLTATAITNVINKANFNNPTTGLNSSNFGRILSAGDPRIMQFGFKFDF